MRVNKFLLPLGLAVFGLIADSKSAIALTWNFDYNYQQTKNGTGTLNYTGSGDGTFNIDSVSFSQDGVSGIYTLDSSSYYYQIHQSNFPNYVTISNGNITHYGFLTTNSSALNSGYDYGRLFSFSLRDDEPVTEGYNVSGTGTPYYNLNINFTQTTASVPFEFDPTQGIALGTPLFIGLRMFKKRRALKLIPFSLQK